MYQEKAACGLENPLQSSQVSKHTAKTIKMDLDKFSVITPHEGHHKVLIVFHYHLCCTFSRP